MLIYLLVTTRKSNQSIVLSGVRNVRNLSVNHHLSEDDCIWKKSVPSTSQLQSHLKELHQSGMCFSLVILRLGTLSLWRRPWDAFDKVYLALHTCIFQVYWAVALVLISLVYHPLWNNFIKYFDRIMPSFQLLDLKHFTIKKWE